MKITIVRRISQVFFLLLFGWFCIISIWGEGRWQLRGWPINWFLELDPLVGIGTLLSTHTLYRGLIWSVVTIILTIIFGRFFCGWLCPFGSLHQFFGYLGSRFRKVKQRIEANHYSEYQNIKYYILIVFLLGAALPLGTTVSLQTGLLDPIPLLHRSVNLMLLPIVEGVTGHLSVNPRFYAGAGLIGTFFITVILLNFWIPRFYCRFLCPAGALMAIFSRFAIWRIGRKEAECIECELCENHCEGACDPFGKIRFSECLLCFNCIHACRQQAMGYQPFPSAAGEITEPDVTRRGLILSIATGTVAAPLLHLNHSLGANWFAQLVRPPGSLSEDEFLKRCLKCGQCMRICPTNIIMPSGMETGFEALWTPGLNFRIGTSGCQLNCVACGHVCPTTAIRPLTLQEKLGIGPYASQGPIRIGTAFVDSSRCLPWSMDKPCIVCQENCPVTPKAIYIKEFYRTIREGHYSIAAYQPGQVTLLGNAMKPSRYASGDYYLLVNGKRYTIIANTEHSVTVEMMTDGSASIKAGDTVELQVRLQCPAVDIEKCIGCGICEHECPVSGLRAIRVTAENESRNQNRSLLLKGGS